MAHILILSYIIILLVGVAAAVYTYQAFRRYDRSFLKSFLHYILVFNLSVSFYLVTRYAWVNVVRHDPASADPSLEGILRLMILLVEIGLAFTVWRVVFEIQGRSLQAVNRAFLLAATLLIASFFIGSGADSAVWSTMTSMVTFYACRTVILGGWIVLGFRNQAGLDPDHRRAVRWLAYLMLSGYVPFAARALLPAPYQSVVAVVARLWLNLVPIIWLQRILLPYYGRLPSTDEGAVVDRLVHEYNISKREREIMQLILEGKSNKEIEGQLFISFNTVKNHVYNLYQKLGVNSRSQLMHLVMKRNDNASKHSE